MEKIIFLQNEVNIENEIKMVEYAKRNFNFPIIPIFSMRELKYDKNFEEILENFDKNNKSYILVGELVNPKNNRQSLLISKLKPDIILHYDPSLFWYNCSNLIDNCLTELILGSYWRNFAEKRNKYNISRDKTIEIMKNEFRIFPKKIKEL